MDPRAAGEVVEATPTSASLVSWNPHAANDMAGQFILFTSGAFALVMSNTHGWAPDICVDQWSSAKEPHGTADPPAAGETYVVWRGMTSTFMSTRPPAPTPDEWDAAAAELAGHERRLR